MNGFYLFGREFELLTDHKPLECIFSPKSKPSARIERWLLRMQPYTFKVKYISGRSNIADALSRLIPKVDNTESRCAQIAEEYVRFVATEATPIAMTTAEIERESKNDPELRAVRETVVSQQ